MATIFHQVLIDAPIETVYNNITTQDGLSQWWIADCTVQPELGFINEFRVEGIGSNRMKVVNLKSNQNVTWECLNDKDDWTGTHVSFELSTRGSLTCLNFRHIGYKEQNEIFATCNYHWARHLSMLKWLCETGTSVLNSQQEKKEIAAVHHH